jgi:hypothetical protein
MAVMRPLLGLWTSAAAALIAAARREGTVVVRLQLRVTLAGIQRIAQIFHREGLLEPFKPLLVLSEVLDGAKWKRRSLWFIESGAALKIDDLSGLALTQA